MQFSALIIAGGKSKRMGFDKTKQLFKGKSFLQRSIELLQFFSDDILISYNDELSVPFRVIPDQIKNIGPLGGLHATLPLARHQHCLVLAADMPLVNRKTIAYLISNADFQKQINILKTNEGYQMLTGIYNKNIFPLIERQIIEKDYKLSHLLQKSTFHLIDSHKFDLDLVNINTRDDLIKLLKENE